MNLSLLAFSPGPQELIIVFVVLLLLFGSTRLPTLARSIGRSINEFKAGMKDKPPSIPDPESESEEEPEKISQ